jgi:hypothetical protein
MVRDGDITPLGLLNKLLATYNATGTNAATALDWVARMRGLHLVVGNPIYSTGWYNFYKAFGCLQVEIGCDPSTSQAKEIIKVVIDNCQKVGAQGDLATAQLHSLLIADYKPKVDNILKLENPEMLRQFHALISEILGGFNAVATNAVRILA